jgi:ketosteroid isomerase-like protein
MKKNYFGWIIISALFLSSCSEQCTKLSDEQKTEIKTQVQEVWTLIGHSVRDADAESFVEYISSENFIAMHSDGVTMNSREEYADSVRSWFGGRNSAKLLNPEIKILPLSGNLALLDQVAGFITVLRDEKADTVQHSVSFLFQKEETGWKIIHGHESWK